MDIVLQEKLLERTLKLFPFLAIQPLKPLAIGAGRELNHALLPYFFEVDVEHFVDRFFSRREYKVALLNCYGEDYTRYNLDGTPSNSTVKENELIGLSRHGMFKDTRGLTSKAANLVKMQRTYVISRRKNLKKRASDLKALGFSDQFLIKRLGKRVEVYLNAMQYKKPAFSQNMIAEAELMRHRTECFSKKELKEFQRSLYNQGVPVYLILLASNYYEPLLFEWYQEKEKESNKDFLLRLDCKL